jgi:gliding motility-associated-like protein
MRSLILLFQLFWISQTTAQVQGFIANSSFEGQPGSLATTPEHWLNCISSSTPDLMPGVFNINLPPAHGNSYVNLVKREGGTVEMLTAMLQKDIDTSKCYFVSLQVAFTDVFTAGIAGEVDFSGPADLVIGFPITPCGFVIVDTILHINNFDGERNQWYTYSNHIKISNPNYEGLKIQVYHSNGNRHGHILIDNFIFEELPQPQMYDTLIHTDFGSSIEIGEPFNPALDYQWLNPNFNCLWCNTQEIQVYESQTHTLVATDSRGIKSQYDYINEVDPIVPNVFSPNDDNVNDLFEYRISNNQFVIEIVNRWGQLVFSTNDSVHYWDGIDQISGKESPDGVYFYTIQFTDYSAITKSKKGFLHLIR